MTEIRVVIGSGVAEIGTTGNISFQRRKSCRSGRICEAVDHSDGTDRKPGQWRYLPAMRRSASQSGRPLSRIRFAAASTS